MTGVDEGGGEPNVDGRPDWVDEAARLTRVALSGNDDAREERNDLVSERGYDARLRDDGVLVLYPADWIDEDGVVDMEAFDADEAYEVPLDGGGFDDAREKNEALLDEFVEEVDDSVAFNAREFAEFCENHHAVAVEDASQKHVDRFVNDYYVRNVWTNDEVEERVEEALGALLREAGRDELADYATK
jgi:hypothetical protein